MTKRRLWIIVIVVIGMGGVGSLGCARKGPPAGISHYTCPMHPQIKMDAPGQCPICGMDLVPVPAASMDEHAAHRASPSLAGGVQIDPARVQHIGVTTDTVQRRTLTRDILAYGKVAHDADLWVAQHEFIEAMKLGDRALIQAAERKLQFLGLSEDWIGLLRKERIADLGLHLPTHNATGYFEAFLSQADVQVVVVGHTASIVDGKGRELARGTVAAIGVVVDPMTRLVRALIKAEQAVAFKLNTFVQLRIQVPLGEHVSVPSSAILFNGDHTMVYVTQDDGRYLPRTVQLGESAGDYYVVREGLREGERVVTNGHFLIDSESHITGGDAHGHQH